MEIYHSLAEVTKRTPAAVALGFFDGLHHGHTTLISGCVQFAKERALSADVFTFKDHPKNVMRGEILVPRLLTEGEKLERLAALGVDRVFDFDFADHFQTISPEDFAQIFLAEAFSTVAAFCGFNYRFGAGAAGNPKTLQAFGETYGFETHVIDPVYIGGQLVSSTMIRRCINSGDVESAGRLLCRAYALKGVVEKGRGLGHSFGFPTANFFPARDMTLPARGVYITEAFSDGLCYPAVTNVGIAPTVNAEDPVRVETHLLDQDLDLYGKEITVNFIKMLREELRFDSKEVLKKQIASDVTAAGRFFLSKST